MNIAGSGASYYSLKYVIIRLYLNNLMPSKKHHYTFEKIMLIACFLALK